MAEVELTEDTLVVHVKGMDRIFALTSRLEISLSHVLDAEVDPELGHPEWWKSLRFTATQIPWVVSAGTFYQEGERPRRGLLLHPRPSPPERGGLLRIHHTRVPSAAQYHSE